MQQTLKPRTAEDDGTCVLSVLPVENRELFVDTCLRAMEIRRRKPSPGHRAVTAVVPFAPSGAETAIRSRKLAFRGVFR